MRRALASAARGVMALVLATAGAGPASAAEPYDSQLREVLVAPDDPAFVEITDPADPSHSGPLDAARLASMGVTLTPSIEAGLRGGYVRGFGGPDRRILQFAYELAEAELAADASAASGRLGTAFDVSSIPGAIGRTVDGATPGSFVSFAMGARCFVVIVGGPDPGHELVQEQALLVAAAAADALAGGPAQALAGAAGSPTPARDEAPAASIEDAGVDITSRALDALRDDEVRLALAAVAAVLVWLVLRASQRRRVPARSPVVPAVRTSSQAWQHATWGTPGTAVDWTAAVAPPIRPVRDDAPWPVPDDAGGCLFPGAEEWPDDDVVPRAP